MVPMRKVKLGRVRSALDELEYPVSRPEAADELAGTTLVFADGEDDLGELVDETREDRFESAEELEAGLHNALPEGAVGEPGQSEGEG